MEDGAGKEAGFFVFCPGIAAGTSMVGLVAFLVCSVMVSLACCGCTSLDTAVVGGTFAAGDVGGAGGNVVATSIAAAGWPRPRRDARPIRRPGRRHARGRPRK